MKRQMKIFGSYPDNLFKNIFANLKFVIQVGLYKLIS